MVTIKDNKMNKKLEIVYCEGICSNRFHETETKDFETTSVNTI